MRKEIPVIPVSRVVYKKVIIRKNGWPRRRRRADPPKNEEKFSSTDLK
jgi:hypothetical protein